jgi:hypothetical protein
MFNYLHLHGHHSKRCQEYVYDMSVRGLGLHAHPIRKLPLTAPLSEALNMLAEHGGAIALVDSLDTLRGNFSAVLHGVWDA